MVMIKLKMNRLIALVLCAVIFLCLTGCSPKTERNVVSYDLLDFDYGCTIEQAETFFGLTEEELLTPYDEQTRSITYDASGLGVGAVQLKLTVGQFSGQNIGVDSITFYFGDDKERAVLFYEAQTANCEEKVLMEERELADKETVCPIYRCYDWADCKDSAYYDFVIGRMPEGTDADSLDTAYPIVQSLMRCWMLPTEKKVNSSYECSFTGFHMAVIRSLEREKIKLPE